MRVHTDANLGAYLSTFASAVPTILYATLLAGQYTTPQIHIEVDAWFTNTAPVDAYRGIPIFGEHVVVAERRGEGVRSMFGPPVG